MGISLKDVELLIRLREAGYLPDRAAVIEIGAQQISNSVLRSRVEVERLGELFGAKSPPPLAGPIAPGGGPSPGGYEPMSQEAPWARDLWTWLGCSYAAIDIDGSPGSIPLDLNFAAVPGAFAGRHHLVTNFGTTEHVANQLNAFKIAHDLTAPGGVMMHTLPALGAFNHGLINYTPKFFWALARANDYRWLFFDFRPDAAPHGIPDNLLDAVRPFRPEIDEFAADFSVTDCSYWVAFQKKSTAAFAPPSDGPPGAATAADMSTIAHAWSVPQCST
jgi:hypothetical protein